MMYALSSTGFDGHLYPDIRGNSVLGVNTFINTICVKWKCYMLKKFCKKYVSIGIVYFNKTASFSK